MRKIIIGLSIIFFILSGVITYRALEMPDYDFSYKSKPAKPVVPVTEPDMQSRHEPLAKEQEASQIQVEKLKATVSTLEEKLADTQKKTATLSETKEPGNREQILAVFGGGTFQSGQVVVSDSLISSVNELVQKVSASPGHRVIIEGHTDNIPIKATAEMQFQDNIDLSFLRAEAIAGMLVENGISRERISVISYGDTRPVTSNNTNEGRAKNRRVEIKLVPDKAEH
jgi:flagellar motor protein MotB